MLVTLRWQEYYSAKAPHWLRVYTHMVQSSGWLTCQCFEFCRWLIFTSVSVSWCFRVMRLCLAGSDSTFLLFQMSLQEYNHAFVEEGTYTNTWLTSYFFIYDPVKQDANSWIFFSWSLHCFPTYFVYLLSNVSAILSIQKGLVNFFFLILILILIFRLCTSWDL